MHDGDEPGGEKSARVAAEVDRPFPAVRNSQPGDAVPNTPEEAAAAFTVPDGFHVTLFAGEPDVAQPIALTFDDRGRLWVAECFTYTGREYDVTHGDRITIFEDADGDGRHDSRTTFWDRGFMLTGLEYGFGGLWVLNDGTLSFIPDRDGDDVPDSEPVAMLDGFTHEAEHNVVSGLRWGPDGWLYGRHGIQATSHVGLPGASEEDRTPLNCGVWRFHPTRHTFEVVARGTTNPWGLDYNESGDWFMTNNVIGHAWHVIPGAHYRRMYGRDFDPHLYGLIDQHADHYHWDADGGDWTASRAGTDGANEFADATVLGKLGGGHSHSGGMIYQGDNWPEECRGDLFMCNTHGRRINRDALVPKGSGYVIEHRDDFAFAGSEWFKGVELKSGPDGGVFVLDWTDLGECHDHDGVHRTSGRIYKIAYGTPERAGEAVDLAGLDAAALWRTAVKHRNVWHRRHAARLLAETGGVGELQRARKLGAVTAVTPAESVREYHATITYIDTLMRDEAAAMAGGEPLGDFVDGLYPWFPDYPSDPGAGPAYVAALRAYLPVALRLAPRMTIPHVRNLAEGPVPRARLAAASAMRRVAVGSRLPIAAALASHPEDADDHNLPLMTWYGVEPAVAADPRAAVDFAADSQIPLLREFTARRLADSLDSERHARALAALFKRAANRDAPFQKDVLTGALAALDGRRKVTPPDGWAELQPVFLAAADADVRAAAQRLGVLFGDGAALEELRAVVSDEAQPDARRIAAIESLAEARDDAVLPDLLNILRRRRLGDRGVQPAAARALAAFDAPEAADVLVDRLESFKNQTRGAALATLVSRPTYARALTDALPGSPIPAMLSADHVRSLRAFGDPEIDRVLDVEWGTTRATPAEKLVQIEAWRTKLTDGSLGNADPFRGREVYAQVCGRCHVLYGEGGNVGPNLTGSGRQNLDYILGNVLDPSATVPAAWRVSTVLLDDGRVLTGAVVREGDTVTIRTADRDVTVPAADVLDENPGTQSLMPEGLFDPLSDEQVRDLVAYLRTARAPD